MNRMDTVWVGLAESMLWSCALVAGLYAVWVYVLSKRWQRGVERAVAAVGDRDLSDVLCLEQETKLEIAQASTKGEFT